MTLLGKRASLLVPGVGCVNGCNFCSTSHFFSKRYTAFLSTGKEIFETAREIADRRGTDSFFVMDENFLKDRQRALELISEMEQHQRFFRFHIFSSAEAILAFGLDNMVRLGVTLVWIGFESQSRQSAFAKNIGVDSKALVEGLRARGISVLGSGILCMEHHTPDNMQADIDFLVDLETDFVQFMLLTPMPVTGLYRNLQRRNLLREDLPYQEWHGQKKLAFRHPAFTDEEAEAWLNRAFRQDYEHNSSSMLRLIDTSFRGYEHLEGLKKRDSCLEKRKQQLATQTRTYALILRSIARNAVNDRERSLALDLDQRIRRRFPRRLSEHLAATAAVLLTDLWKLRLKLRGDQIQPRTIVTRYRAERNFLAGQGAIRDGGSGHTINSDSIRPAAAAVTISE